MTKKNVNQENLNLNEDEWRKKYNPAANHLNENASWFDEGEGDENGRGVLFETFGEEYEFVSNSDYHKVWTYISTEDGEAIINGIHFVNRIGYFVCEFPWLDGQEIEVDIN